MTNLRDLYQDAIVDHYRKPRNFRRIEQADTEAEGHNPLCGDRFSVYLQIQNDRIRDIAFQGAGCAISTASASMMTESLKGKTVDEANAVIRSFKALLTGCAGSRPEADSPLSIFSSVRDYPVRVKCALIAWDAVNAALKERKTLPQISQRLRQV